jgi:hypothetical protein
VSAVAIYAAMLSEPPDTSFKPYDFTGLTNIDKPLRLR